MKVLVVDDDPICRLVLEDTLAGFGEVTVCEDGEAAVRAARMALAIGSPYDLICMDLIMPTMNGLDALSLIRQEEESQGRPRASKVIVTTSREDGESINEAFGHLCDAYIVKPVDTEKFLGVLDCLCDGAVTGD